MWTREKVDSTLTSYKDIKGKHNHLLVEIREREYKFDKLKAHLAADELSPKAQVITDMPRGGSAAHSALEETVIKVADGWMPPELKQMEQEILALKDEAKWLGFTVDYVEGWLQPLSDRERMVVEHQVMDGECWDKVITDYHSKFGEWASSATLKRVKKKSLQQIYSSARCAEPKMTRI